jgi:hypothetical protein
VRGALRIDEDAVFGNARVIRFTSGLPEFGFTSKCGGLRSPASGRTRRRGGCRCDTHWKNPRNRGTALADQPGRHSRAPLACASHGTGRSANPAVAPGLRHQPGRLVMPSWASFRYFVNWLRGSAAPDRRRRGRAAQSRLRPRRAKAVPLPRWCAPSGGARICHRGCVRAEPEMARPRPADIHPPPTPIPSRAGTIRSATTI